MKQNDKIYLATPLNENDVRRSLPSSTCSSYAVACGVALCVFFLFLLKSSFNFSSYVSSSDLSSVKLQHSFEFSKLPIVNRTNCPQKTLSLTMSMPSYMDRMFENLRITLPYIFKVITTTPILLGYTSFHQFFIFGCLFAQICTTLLLVLIYYDQLNANNTWWLIIECMRVCIAAIIRVDRLIINEPNLFFNNNENRIFKLIAGLNVFGAIWACPVGIFYVTLCLKHDEASMVFFIMTFVYISLHLLSSIPSISKISRLITINQQSLILNDDHKHPQFGNSFLESSIDADYQEINENKEEDDEDDDDPILYTAPFNDEDNLLSMTQLLRQQQENQESHQFEVGDDDISDSEEVGDDENEHQNQESESASGL